MQKIIKKNLVKKEEFKVVNFRINKDEEDRVLKIKRHFGLAATSEVFRYALNALSRIIDKEIKNEKS